MTPERANGYTLLELLVVLGILSLIAAFAVPAAGRTIEGVALQADARALVVMLRRLESQAMEKQETISVTIADGKLVTSSGDELDPADGGKIAFLGKTERIDLFPDGSSNGGKLAIGRGDQALEIDVGWLSGDVKVAE
jgi:general secretion pathway protein H